MFEQKYFERYSAVIGCDEVGRGPIAGPVVGCAVILKNNKYFLQQLQELGVTDSKKLTHKKRQNILQALTIDARECFKKVTHEKFSYVLWEHSPAQIDEMNILQASLSCMSQAAKKLLQDNSVVLVDGNHAFKNFPADTLAVVKGDSKSLAIGLASIIAKEFRDEKMRHFDQLYPGYGLAKHAGYPTAFHKEAVKNLGVTPIHRKSFRGVKEYVKRAGL